MASSSQQRSDADPDIGPAEELQEILYSAGDFELIIVKDEPPSSDEGTYDYESAGLGLSASSCSLITVTDDTMDVTLEYIPVRDEYKPSPRRVVKPFQTTIKPYRKIVESKENGTIVQASSEPVHSVMDIDSPPSVTPSPANGIYTVRPYNRYVPVEDKLVTGGLDKTSAHNSPKGSLAHLFYCHHCDYSTLHKGKLRIHTLGHLPREYSCSVCPYKSKTRKYLEAHMQTHTGEKHLACTECAYMTRWKHNLVTHMRTHSQEKPYACHLCPYRTKTSTALKGHLNIHNDVRKWKCPYCPYSAVQKNCLKDHITTHTGEKRHQCPHCDFKTGRKSSLRDHIRLKHVRIKNLQCPYCEYRSAHKGNMKSHIRTHTDERPYACDKCDYRAHTSDVLKKHNMIHTGERPFACDFCPYRSVQEATMISHVNSVHFKNAPFQCHHCGYCTGRFRVLRTHIMNHMGIRNRKCDHPGCKFRTSSQSSLVIHKRNHTGDKPYICASCPYRCVSNSMMKGHLLTHLTVKPFNCTECDFSTARKTTLTTHMLIHSKEKPFACKFCPYKSRRVRQLREHTVKYH